MNSISTAPRSLHGKVREQLRESYLESDGKALPSLRELSRQLGVNHATISRALRDLEKEGVVEVVPRKGVFSVAAIEQKSLNKAAASAPAIELALFASEHQSVLDIALSLTKGMERICNRRVKASEKSAAGRKAPSGVLQSAIQITRSILNVPPLPNAEKYVADLRERNIGAVAFLGFGYLDFPHSHRESAFLFEVSRQIPVVLIGGPHPDLPLDCVWSDPRPQLKTFLEDSYVQGFRRFEYLGSRTGLPHQRLRHEEFCRFVMSRDLTWPGNDFDELSTPSLASQLKKMKKLPEVVVAANINRALTFILEAQRRGAQLPEEIRVLCFASILEQAAPILPYSSIALLDEVAVGERAARFLLERWNQAPAHKAQAALETVPAQLIRPAKI